MGTSVAPFQELNRIKKFTARKSAGARIWAASQPSAASERSNKKADVVAMMKRANGATLDEVVAATGWQKHPVHGS